MGFSPLHPPIQPIPTNSANFNNSNDSVKSNQFSHFRQKLKPPNPAYSVNSNHVRRFAENL
ncbi:hypothetical protein [Neisseria polysaccharea]|uniref:hypothetical protein n=1 Tax=Neisseria polysaccharea TaxID=489 RepID=UPI000E0DBC3D|nr:hypothetical protein [Neisseria polysaccharea]